MKQFKLFLSIAGILVVGFQLFAQQGGKDPERFYNVESYKADITLTFNYQLKQSGETISRSVSASQKFQHFFTTAPGARTIGDLFQIQRDDKGKEETHKGDLYGDRINLDKMAKAMENSNVDPKVLEMLNQSKKEGQSFNISLNKYKNWMVGLPESLVSSSIYSEFSDESKGTLHCGEGQGEQPYVSKKNYDGTEHTDLSKPDLTNPNSFVLQLNLDNNSYSFLTSIKMPQGSQFRGNSYTSECGRTSNKPVINNADAFISIKGKKEGLIYKHPLPESGLVLSGTKIITDSFAIGGQLNEENANWSVKIDWSISPTDR